MRRAATLILILLLFAPPGCGAGAIGDNTAEEPSLLDDSADADIGPGPDAPGDTPTADTPIDPGPEDAPPSTTPDVSTPDVPPRDDPPITPDVVDPDPGGLTPPLGGSSGGRGGGAANGATRTTPEGVQYRLIVPGAYSEARPNGLMIVFSGVEGGATMTSNLQGAAPAYGLGDLIFAVLDGATYFGDGGAGASVLDHVRGAYNIDNDRTFLLSESAGTRAGLQLGLDLRQSFFAAYWANDVNAAATPRLNAQTLGFAPWGNAGPGGDLTDANAIVNGMRSSGYRIAEPAPYDGPGSTQHGNPQQFLAALSWFRGKSRNP